MTNSVHKGIFLFLLLFFSVTSYSQSIRQQQLKHDSIKQAISVAKDDTNKVHLYLKLIQNIGRPTQELYESALSAYELSKRLKFYYGEVRACFALSKYYESEGDLVKAMELISQGLIQAQKTNGAKLKVSCRRQLDDVYYKSKYSKEIQLIYTNTIDKMQDDTVKVKTINSFNENDDDAYKTHLDYANRSLALCEKLDYTKGKTEVYGFLTYYYLDVGNDHKKAIWAANKALEMARKANNKEDEGKALGVLGKVYQAEDLHREGTNYYLTSLKIFEQIKDISSQFISCTSLGNSYNNLGLNYLDSSIYYLKRARLLVDELGSDSELLEEMSREDLKAIVDQNLGMSYLNMKDTLNGNKYIQSSAKVLTTSNSFSNKDSLGKVVAYSSLAYLYAVKKSSDSVFYFTNKKLSTQPLNINFYAGDLKTIAEYYFKKGNYLKAYNLLHRSYDVNDSLKGIDSKKQVQDILLKYQSAEKEKQIVDLNKNKLLKESELKTSRAIIITVTSAFLFILLVLIFTWYFYQNKRKTEQLVSEKKEISALLEGQEKERERIAADLHDRLGSMLATVKLYFNSVEENIQQLKKENKEYYSKASSLLDDACEEVRKISHDLASGVLLKFGLVAALKELQDTVSKSNQLQMQLNIFGMEKRLPIEMESNIYRIVQELLNNTLKHANAKSFSVQLNNNGNNLNLLVEDDGMGFDPNKLKDNTGIGLKNVNERLRKLNAKLELDAIIGRGTTYIINIPLLD